MQTTYPLLSLLSDTQQLNGILYIFMHDTPEELRIPATQLSRRITTNLDIMPQLLEFIEQGRDFMELLGVAQLSNEVRRPGQSR